MLRVFALQQAARHEAPLIVVENAHEAIVAPDFEAAAVGVLFRHGRQAGEGGYPRHACGNRQVG